MVESNKLTFAKESGVAVAVYINLHCFIRREMIYDGSRRTIYQNTHYNGASRNCQYLCKTGEFFTRP